ncbi:hypothetical protein BDV95DRAFT_13721 [Massariosphaeria phaeospora]|uniref:Uncharacterized protein n=1 Tax=Massariosphaeria phaeospora TaxID=100035 RepID=A0A7C8IF99_9PLEO|nr:hypothetical protein BDV95DRAFT_13721 [Massariosphaeria phaeospora]
MPRGAPRVMQKMPGTAHQLHRHGTSSRPAASQFRFTTAQLPPPWALCDAPRAGGGCKGLESSVLPLPIPPSPPGATSRHLHRCRSHVRCPWRSYCSLEVLTSEGHRHFASVVFPSTSRRLLEFLPEALAPMTPGPLRLCDKYETRARLAVRCCQQTTARRRRQRRCGCILFCSVAGENSGMKIWAPAGTAHRPSRPRLADWCTCATCSHSLAAFRAIAIQPALETLVLSLNGSNLSSVNRLFRLDNTYVLAADEMSLLAPLIPYNC